MTSYLKILAHKRKRLLDLTKDLTVEQYNAIPDGFNNNIIWNMGHALSVSERMLYDESGLQPRVHAIPLTRFNKGTRPGEDLQMNEVSYIRTQLLNSVHLRQEKDGETGIAEHKPRARSIEFLLFHEDYHYHRITELIRAL